ncbi:hypothetical protein [Neoasaia chiangmaiensis]|nr:hypothetical protein [Neoasaia chiangmaiensis]
MSGTTWTQAWTNSLSWLTGRPRDATILSGNLMRETGGVADDRVSGSVW